MIENGGMDGAADDQLRQSGFFGDAPGNVTIVVASLKPSRVIRGVRVVVVVVVVVVDVLVDVGAKHSNVVLVASVMTCLLPTALYLHGRYRRFSSR